MTFSSNHRLRAHVDTHTDTRYACNQCDGIYKTKQSLQGHISKYQIIKDMA